MTMETLRRAWMNPWPALLSAGLIAGQSVRTRGVRRTALFVALGLGLPALAEAYAVTLRRDLRHHMQPQLKGVPLNAILGWYTITYAVFSLLESIGIRHGLDRHVQRWVLPPSTAAVATSLDLILDCVGLDLGLWEWSQGGPYAPEVSGPNGQHGIPVANFVGWLALTGSVTGCYLLLEPRLGEGPPPRGTAGRRLATAGRTAVLVLLPYYLAGAGWALGRRRPRYLLYSALCPLVLADALTARGRGSN
jgi:Carotenoid biosynthesis protein